ncbi:D-alanyl-D-alanine carboxypeptidase [candidate division WOR-3 bacterium]|nr:D-alanyl-D-alanine carboxypeptidase [candidate division WOR-3 bacterium]
MVSLRGDSLVFASNESCALVPASTAKLLTAARALEAWDDSLARALEARLARSRERAHRRLLDSLLLDSLGIEHPAGVPPGWRYLAWMNRRSDNRIADWLYSLMPGSTAAFLEARGIPAPGLVVEDGSGLSRRNRAAAITLARLLAEEARGPDAEAYVATLPRPGEPGTLARRGLGVGSRLRGKTGYLRASFALAGLLDTGEDTLAFAFLANNCPSGRSAYRLFTRLLRSLDRDRGPASP